MYFFKLSVSIEILVLTYYRVENAHSLGNQKPSLVFYTGVGRCLRNCAGVLLLHLIHWLR